MTAHRVKTKNSSRKTWRQPLAPGVLPAAQCEHLLRSLGLLALAQFAVALACTWLLLGRVRQPALVGWLVAVGLSQSVALLLWQRRQPGADAEAGSPALHRLLRAGSVVNGLLWGLLPWWLLPREPRLDAFVAFVVACLSGGVAVAIGFDAAAALGFASAALLPLSAWLSLGDSTAAQAQAVVAAAWLLFLALAVRSSQRRFARGLGWRARALREVARRDRQMQRMRRMARLDGVLAEISRIGSEADDRQGFEQEVCRAAVRRGALAQAWVAQVDPATQALRVTAEASATTPATGLLGRELAEQARDDGQACFGTAAGGDDTAAPACIAALPLRAEPGEPERDAPRGVLVLCFSEPDVFDSLTTEVLLHIGLAVERGLLAMEQHRRMARLQSLYRALMSEGDVLLQARNVPDMLLRTCQTLTEGTQFHAAWMARPDEHGRIEVIARAGSGADQLDALRISLHDEDQSPLVLRVWSSHRNACSNDLLGDPRMAPWRASMSAYDWRSALAVPVFRAGAIWAVLVFVSPQPNSFDRQTTELCQRVAELLGHGLDELDTKRRLNDLQMEESHRARHDLLTGLPNRFALTQYLPQALAAARQDGSVLAVGMIDLDDFKPVNDTWGHDAGDSLLRELGQRLRGAIRKFDLLARLGGDEFVVVIEQIDAEDVLAQLTDVLQRLHAAVQAPFELAPGCQARVGMTMGLALYPLDGQDPDALVRQADAAMYQAKLHKRDRERWWQLAGASSARLGSPAPRALAQLHLVSSDGAVSDRA